MSPASSAAAQEELPSRSPTSTVDARVAQVERVGVALAAVAEHGDLAGEEVDVAFVMHCCAIERFLLGSGISTGGRAADEGCGLRTPREPDPAGAGELAHAVRAEELLEGVELLRACPTTSKMMRVGAEVGDARVEHLGERDQLGAPARVGAPTVISASSRSTASPAWSSRRGGR